jgi:hypothetical protein
VAVGNSKGEISIYDLSNGRLLERLDFGRSVEYAKFGKYGKKLLVLTDDQEAILLDATKFGKAKAEVAIAND